METKDFDSTDTALYELLVQYNVPLTTEGLCSVATTINHCGLLWFMMERLRIPINQATTDGIFAKTERLPILRQIARHCLPSTAAVENIIRLGRTTAVKYLSNEHPATTYELLRTIKHPICPMILQESFKHVFCENDVKKALAQGHSQYAAAIKKAIQAQQTTII
jgi:hypothetical protein